MLREQSSGVRADAEVRGVAERNEAGVAEDEVERQREQRSNGDLAGERQVVRRDDEGQQRAQPEDDLQGSPAQLLLKMAASVFQTILQGATSIAPPSRDR